MKNSFKGVTRGRFLILSLLVCAVAVFPSSAQADPVTDQESGCTVQLQFAGPPTNGVEFTFRGCNFEVAEIQGLFDRPAAFFPPIAGIIGTEPAPSVFGCRDPGFTPTEPQSLNFDCQTPVPLSRAGRGSISVPPGQNPCEGNLLQINEITFSRTDNPLQEGNQARTATVGNNEPDIFLQGCPDTGETGDPGGGGEETGQRQGAEERCPDGSERNNGGNGGDGGDGETRHTNEDRETGDFEGEHFDENPDGTDGTDGSDGFDGSCPGKPKGGVETGGFGGIAEAVGYGGNVTPLLLAGSGLLLVGLLGGGLALARRH